METSTGTGEAKKILIIDDDQSFLEIFSTKLGAAGFDVTIATGGRQGIEKACDVHPDLILLDIRMPDMDGIETLKELQTNNETKDLKVSFLSVYENPNDDDEINIEIKIPYIRKAEDLNMIVADVQELL